jgi:7,8-dihydropterin-6-yl-methyl-4-(beta-D-ribofuranosyl)aminobenzene 5'-phosphate synthase
MLCLCAVSGLSRETDSTGDAVQGQTSLELDELSVLVLVDNETDTLSSVDSGVPQVPEMGRLVPRLPVTSTHADPLMKELPEPFLCSACHGYSVLVTGRIGTVSRTMLFDTGPDADLWLGNASKLGIDLTQIEVIFLSHWHYDHSGAMPKVVAAVAGARAAAGLPPPLVDLHPQRPDQRGFTLPNGEVVLLPAEPELSALEAAGGELRLSAEPHLLCGNYFYVSGEVPRLTSYETGFTGHVSLRGGQSSPDPLIVDERFFAALVRGRGLTVMSACSHAGIVNTCLEAQQVFSDVPVDAVIGGFHLSGLAMEQRIDDTVRDLRELISPRIVAPGHCSGWRAKAELARNFAPLAYGPSVVGSTYRLQAP